MAPKPDAGLLLGISWGLLASSLLASLSSTYLAERDYFHSIGAVDQAYPETFPSGIALTHFEKCRLARRLAESVAAIPGVQVANDVVLNHVLIRVGDHEFTNTVEDLIQKSRAVWLGGTTWRGERLLRVAISNWLTTDQDIDRTIDAIAQAVDHARDS